MSTSTLVMVLVAVVVFWLVGAYNRLMRHKNAIANAFDIIDTQLKCRYDLALSTVEFLKKYVYPERNSLEAVMTARNLARAASEAVRSRPTHAQSVAALSVAEDALIGALNYLFSSLVANPELKANAALRELEHELFTVGGKMDFTCQVYNAAVLDYNNAQGQFPVLVIAKLFGFTPSVQLLSAAKSIELQTTNLQV